MSARRSLFAVSIAALAVACASGGGATQGEGPVRAERNRISYEEIQQSQHANLHDFIRAARPQWFRQQPGSITQGSNPRNVELRTATGSVSTSSATGGDALNVFMDGRRIGGADVLGTIAVAHVREIRYYSQSEAASRFSVSSAAPAIEIITRTQ